MPLATNILEEKKIDKETPYPNIRVEPPKKKYIH